MRTYTKYFNVVINTHYDIQNCNYFLGGCFRSWFIIQYITQVYKIGAYFYNYIMLKCSVE